jgi:hypothetical protein
LVFPYYVCDVNAIAQFANQSSLSVGAGVSEQKLEIESRHAAKVRIATQAGDDVDEHGVNDLIGPATVAGVVSESIAKGDDHGRLA